MKPDSIELPPESLRPEPVRRVKPSRQKEREERKRDFEDLARQKARKPKETDKENRPTPPVEPPTESSDVPAGKSTTGGKRLDLLV